MQGEGGGSLLSHTRFVDFQILVGFVFAHEGRCTVAGLPFLCVQDGHILPQCATEQLLPHVIAGTEWEPFEIDVLLKGVFEFRVCLIRLETPDLELMIEACGEQHILMPVESGDNRVVLVMGSGMELYRDVLRQLVGLLDLLVQVVVDILLGLSMRILPLCPVAASEVLLVELPQLTLIHPLIAVFALLLHSQLFELVPVPDIQGFLEVILRILPTGLLMLRFFLHHQLKLLPRALLFVL